MLSILTRCACSYEAAEDNELSFREGDRIVEIEAVSDEWWQGKDAHGNVGLFPGMSTGFLRAKPRLTMSAANYVEVQGE